MAREYVASIGSGTVPHIAHYNPTLSGNAPNGRFPIITADGKLFHRSGTGSIILNFEDASVFLGIEGNAISVTSPETAIPPVPLVNRRSLAIANIGPGILYIGKLGVTTSTGFPIAVGEKIAFDIQGNANVTIYGVSDSTSDVRYFELA